MIAAVQRCPKCRAELRDGEDACAKCGIIFAKCRPLDVRSWPSRTSPSVTERPWIRVARQWLIESDDRADSITFVGRAGIFALLLWWGWNLIVSPMESNAAGESFLHLINLSFHEAGHLIFMPFGRFMMFLGGSLGQILIPIVCLVTFLIKTRDPFGASVALWWTAESFMDLAPYINDARTLDLMLLGGVTGNEADGHDWENILSMLGWLEYDHRLAYLVYDVGMVLMLASFAWGGVILLRQARRLSR